ncbi:hypothetical protein [Pseudomonas koreensis]|uniref:Uncharacterized protein n=1 Tax=Pseudomonas koreensis TaxID=198620 RepID=A0A9X2XE90_9PSED|nr:hypothetical protein [Pseudomonas koreensis]MCU7246998.1 hypothetical protein [Pseudomonas koreensis]
MQQLKDALVEQEGADSVSWQGYEVKLQETSSLHEVFMPGRVIWNQMLKHTLVFETIRDHKPKSLDYIRITGEAKIEMLDQETLDWRVVEDRDRFRFIPELADSQARIGDIAKQAGGYIHYEDFVSVEQWLTFHDLDVPKNPVQIKNLIDFLDFDIPVADSLSHYWAQLVADDASQVVLTTAQYQAVRQVTAQLVASDQRLLDVLYEQVGLSSATHDNAAEQIGKLLRHPVSQGYAWKYIELLNWYGVEAGQSLSGQDLGQVLLTAILLDLNPFIGKKTDRKAIGSFALYAPAFVERPSFIALEGLRSHLLSNQWVSSPAQPLAAHLLLADIAPEFLVRQIPSSVLMGSLDWVALCRGVALVDATSRGAASAMTYSQVMAYAALEPVSPAQERLHALALIDPIVDWALMNAVITAEELQQDKKAATERAISAYQHYTDSYAGITHAFATPLPDRRVIARAALQRLAPGCDFVEDALLFQRPGLYASPTAMSMLDLHVSGDLAGGEWDFRDVHPFNRPTDLLGSVTHQPRPNRDPSVVSVYERFPRLLELKPVSLEFRRQLAEYLEKLDRSLIVQLRLALAQLPKADLESLLKSEISLFTVRDTAEFIRKTPVGPITLNDKVENQEGRDAATGRYGVVMCFSSRDRLICYEVFTLRGEVRLNPALGKFIVDSGKMKATSRMEYKGDLKAQRRATPKERVPLDLKRYTQGIGEATSSMAIIEKLAVLPAPAAFSRLAQSVYRNFSDPQVVQLAEFIGKWRSLVTFDELEAIALQPTALEIERQKGELTATYLVDLAVPFKKCIEDIGSGEYNRIIDGVYGCAMDTIALVGTFAGAAAKTASISSKSISLGAKGARVAAVMVGTSISLFNPLDDVPAVLSGFAKLLQKGGLRLGKQAQQLIAQAKTQLGKTRAGQASQNALRASADVTVGQGSWRPQGAVGDTLSVVAARQDFQWYALDRRGRPWGQKLSGFSYQRPAQRSQSFKTLPESYTRHFISRSLPRAQLKIENAIHALTLRDFANERALVFRMLLGKAPVDALDRMLKYLKAVRTDFAGSSLSNYVLDPYKDSDNLAVFDMTAYKIWKDSGAADTPFIEIHSQNLNRHFVKSGFNHEVIADDLIHEMFHGAANTVDVSYARETALSATGQVLDVAPLLNLARGCLPVSDEDREAGYHAVSKAFENADSLALTASLLSQLYADKATYLENMSVMTAAVQAQGDGPITQPVLVKLNKASALG